MQISITKVQAERIQSQLLKEGSEESIELIHELSAMIAAKQKNIDAQARAYRRGER